MDYLKQVLNEELKNPEFAKSYGTEVAKSNIGLTIYKVRKSLNLTQQQLSEKLKISQPYIAKLESGEANPTIAAIGQLLGILGYSLVTDVIPLNQEPNTINVSILDNPLYCFNIEQPLNTIAAAMPVMGIDQQVQVLQASAKQECYLASTACSGIGGIE